MHSLTPPRRILPRPRRRHLREEVRERMGRKNVSDAHPKEFRSTRRTDLSFRIARRRASYAAFGGGRVAPPSLSLTSAAAAAATSLHQKFILILHLPVALSGAVNAYWPGLNTDNGAETPTFAATPRS
mmetsp:Transcript_39737/g.119450  ORF Transcript_39737/g.119450 Transcript_39737/m.119450 type:complete len:128 (-) Transcript_39737:474-857(-)